MDKDKKEMLLVSLIWQGQKNFQMKQNSLMIIF